MLCDSSTSYNLSVRATSAAAVVVGSRVAAEAANQTVVEYKNSNIYHEMPTTPTFTITSCSNDLTSLADQYLTTTASSDASSTSNSKINNHHSDSTSNNTNNTISTSTTTTTTTPNTASSINSIANRRATRTNRAHPNIQHHTPIHPHSKYSRQRNTSVSNSISESKTTGSIATSQAGSGDDESRGTQATTTTTTTKFEFLSSNGDNFGDYDDYDDEDDEDENYDDLPGFPHTTQYRFLDRVNLDNCTESEVIRMIEELDKEIVKLQGLIVNLNKLVLSDDANRAKPPAEYLDVYNDFTDNIHNIQNEKLKLEERLSELRVKVTTSSSMEEDEPPGEVISISNLNRRLSTHSSHQLEDDSMNNQNSSYNNSRATSQNGSRNNSSHNINQSVSMSSIACNSPLPTGSSNIPYFNYDSGAKSPHLTKKSQNSSTSSNFKSSSGNLNTKHPTSLNTVNGGVNNKRTFQSVSKPSTPTLPISNSSMLVTKPTISYNNSGSTAASSMSTSLTTSPATTPTALKASVSPPRDIHMNKKHSISGVSGPSQHSYSHSVSLTTSSSSLTLPLNNVLYQSSNNNNSLGIDNALLLTGPSVQLGNSKSYGDINDAVQTPSGSSQLSGERVSPSSSAVTTPTVKTPFLRVIIGYSTAVIEKKPIPLKDALSSKLKSRNLEIDKCIAFYEDTNIKIDWNTEVNRITAEIIEVAEVGDTIRHNFEKKTFTIRQCDSCKKHLWLNVYSCTKCDYIMCQKTECRERTEKVVCAPRKSSMSSSATPAATPSASSNPNGRSEFESGSKISQQILPVQLLKVNHPSRDRSRSENEINAEKLLNENHSHLVHKSPSNFDKSTDNSINSKKNIDSVSGSVNEVSGSVSKIYGSSTTGSTIGPLISEIKPEVTGRKTFKEDQRVPSRRDSFNSWEIPYTQIKIDTNQKVGSGSFGIVHKGWDYYQAEVAVKFLNVQHPSLSQASAFRNEVAILKSARHENILLFIGCIFRPYMAIVTEWCPGSSLYRHIHVQEEERWEMTEIVNIARQISIGMEYLHARDILHRDLKSNNIFLIPKSVDANMPMRRRHHHHRNFKKSKAENNLDDFLSHEVDTNKWIVKIGDFGLATVKSAWVQNSPKSNQPTGSILWMAPEVITQKVPDPYTAKSDVYSYAVVLYELVTNMLPYGGKEQNMILYLVGSGRLRPNPDDARPDTPKELKELISICSQYDRDKRLDFVGVNKSLKELKLVKQKKIERAQSVPNVSFSPESSVFDIGSSIYEDEVYPISPQMRDLIYESYEESSTAEQSSPDHDVLKPIKSNSSDDYDDTRTAGGGDSTC